MINRRTMLKLGAATSAGLLLPPAYRQGRALAATKSGLFFGYKPFTQPLFIPEVLTSLKGGSRLFPAPGAYPRPSGTSGRPRTPTGNCNDVTHGIAPEFGLGPAEWNRFKSGFSPGNTHEQEFDMVTEETTHRFVPGGPDVPVFTYRDGTKAPGSGTTPGPTIVAEYLAPVVLRNCNQLTRNRGGVNSTNHDIETSIHLHGSHGTAHADGFPDFYVLAGEARDYFYPNIAPKVTDPVTLIAPVRGGTFDTTWIPTTLWYHDHAMDITGFNVSRGLAGFYLVFDDRQRELAARGVIPPTFNPDGTTLAKDVFGGPLDIGLALQDQRFNADGTLFYDFLDHNGRLGDVFTVNGVVQPTHKVEKRKYRFRILNASNARIYEIRLSTRQKMCIIGTDSWLLPRAIEVESFQIGQGQRHDVIIDFRDAPGEVFLENILVQTDGRGAIEVDPAKERDQLLRFEVGGINSSEPRCVDGTVIRGLAGIDPDGQFSFHRAQEIVATRSFEFDRSGGAWMINSRFFNPRRADATPVLGKGAERWIFENGGGGWWHPIHVHLEGFQIKTVNGKPPRRERQFNSDLVELEGGFKAEVFVKWRTFTGPYAFHCHAVEHEDMRMMGVNDPTPGAGGSTDPIVTHPPLDGVHRIDPNVSGVVPDCTELEQDQRIFFDEVGDVKRVADQGVGFPDCKFDVKLGNQGGKP
jgi:FtsP/CotA-like multicopper oxidase with cupredoxin domain